MNNKKFKNILIIVVCISISIGVIIINFLDKGKSKEVNLKDEKVAQVNTEESTKDKEMIPESNIEDDALYDEEASDGYAEPGQQEITVYLKNGEVLYDSEDIPLNYYDSLMNQIQKFCDLNYEGDVKEIEILPDSIIINDQTIEFKGNLKNGHFLKVSYDVESKQYTLSDSIK